METIKNISPPSIGVDKWLCIQIIYLLLRNILCNSCVSFCCINSIHGEYWNCCRVFNWCLIGLQPAGGGYKQYCNKFSINSKSNTEYCAAYLHKILDTLDMTTSAYLRSVPQTQRSTRNSVVHSIHPWFVENPEKWSSKAKDSKWIFKCYKCNFKTDNRRLRWNSDENEFCQET